MSFECAYFIFKMYVSIHGEVAVRQKQPITLSMVTLSNKLIKSFFLLTSFFSALLWLRCGQRLQVLGMLVSQRIVLYILLTNIFPILSLRLSCFAFGRGVFWVSMVWTSRKISYQSQRTLKMCLVKWIQCATQYNRFAVNARCRSARIQ